MFTAGSLQEEEEGRHFLSARFQRDDLQRLRPGSIFRWVIGYARSASGTKAAGSHRSSFATFLPMTKQDLSKGKEWARKIAQSMAD